MLKYIHAMHPEAEKVDFIVERKEGVFEKLKHFYDTFEDGLKYIGEPELVKYLGEINSAEKEGVPVQAADMLCWHASRADLGILKGRDAVRAAMLFNRKGKHFEIADSIHHQLAAVFAEKMNEQEHGVSEVRRNNEEAHSSSSRQAKSRAGPGKGRKAKKRKPKASASGRASGKG